MKTTVSFWSALLLLLMACSTLGETTNVKRNKTTDPIGKTEGSRVISGPVVWKQRVIKGEIQEEGDYFIQRSIQDYFIKFCESAVTKEQLETYLNAQLSEVKVVQAEVEFKEGYWDICHQDIKEQVASRTGPYVVIHRIIEK